MAAFSKEAFISGFIAETTEHLETIDSDIVTLKKSQKDYQVLAEILRELHTIKGSARMLGFPTIESLSHGLEDVFKGVREEKYEVTDHIVRLTLKTSERIKKALDAIHATGSDSIEISAYTEAYTKASAGLFFSLESLEDGAEKEDSEEVLQWKDGEATSLENITSIRIDLNRINEIVRAFNNIIIRQFRFKHQLEELEEKINSSEGVGVKKFPRQLKEDLLLTESAIFDTQHRLLNLRMLPLEIVLSPLRKEIDSETLKLGKNIEFSVPTTDFMMDKAILEKLRDILLHLVRNCIDHGIESPERRKELGKDETGHIQIKAQQISNHIVISVSDDGQGIQYEKVRKRAELLYPKQKKDIETMDNRGLQQYLFLSGFSTTETPTQLSGRGVGLDVVRDHMEKIKGRIRLHTKENEGTTFELTIPLTLATQQGLFIHAGQMKFMVPSHYITEIMELDKKKLAIMQGQSFVTHRGQLIPVYYLSSIIGQESHSDNSSIIIVEYLETQIAIVVDSIDQYENVVVNPLPPIMQAMHSLQGIVYDENYAIIPILNIPDIMSRMKRLLAYDIKKYETKNKKRVYTVLVVDDSSTTRQIEQTIFETDGYHVEIAQDGIDALDKLKSKHIDAIISDIKMPRMDGMVLLNNIRLNEDYANIPVVIVSGVYDPDVKKEFLDAGAQAFIIKSEFQRGNLLQAVKELLGE